MRKILINALLIFFIAGLTFCVGCLAADDLTFNDACDLLKEEMLYGNEYNYEFSTERLNSKKVFVIEIRDYKQHSSDTVKLLPAFVSSHISGLYYDFIEENFSNFSNESIKIEIYDDKNNLVYYEYIYGYYRGRNNYN
ncbi:MAG: hypothetical protein IJA97_05225 [Clostridia bacterium]|nr:hypothetical protein [Clostridia bacterium]